MRLEAESQTTWRKAVKRAGLKLTTKAAREAAAEFRKKMAEALAAERGAPGAKTLDAKAIARAEAKIRKKMEEREAETRAEKVRTVQRLMAETKMTKEEVMEAWHASVIEVVMTA